MNLIRKNLQTTSLVLCASLLGSQMAMADYTCRDYYTDYIDMATQPTPVIVVVGDRPHYHNHYPVYHSGYHGDDHGGGGGNHGGGNAGGGSDEAGAIVGLAILAGLLTTTAVQDEELQSAIDTRDVIDEAQMGDGPNLQKLLAEVRSDAKNPAITEAQVANLVNVDNVDLSFCSGGDLDSIDELATLVSSQIPAPAPAPAPAN
jgi:hypothetical protein